MDEKAKTRLEKATRDFEAIFVSYVLKSMRGSDSANEIFGDSYGGDLMADMFDSELAKHLTRGTAFGLGEMMYRGLTGEPYPRARQHVQPMHAESRQASPAFTKPVSLDHGKVQEKSGTNPANNRENASAQQPTQTNALPRTVGKTSKLREPEKVTETLPLSVGPKSLDERMKAYSTMIDEAAAHYSIDSSLIKAVIATESGAGPHSRSPKSAKGLMQLLDSTAAEMGVQRIWDPRENIFGGVKYLRQQLDRFHGNVSLAAAAYNAGAGAVQKHGGIPPYKETREYVERVMNYLEFFQAQEGIHNDDD